jgi:hypothetical protein
MFVASIESAGLPRTTKRRIQGTQATATTTTFHLCPDLRMTFMPNSVFGLGLRER